MSEQLLGISEALDLIIQHGPRKRGKKEGRKKKGMREWLKYPTVLKKMTGGLDAGVCWLMSG